MTGLLLVNLGTPDAPETSEVRAYLAEFLSDPRVLDIGAIGRWLLLNVVILPRRPAQSAAAYKKIWTERGSPLLFHSQDLAARVGEALGPGWRVELAMRYGRPSLPAALDRFRAAGIDRIVLFPLYPQYAGSSTGSSIEAALRLALDRWVIPSLAVIPPFYEHAAFIDAFAAVGRPVLDDFTPDHVLMSFHGLPERQCRKTDDTGKHCLASPTCCDAIVEANRNCYRAQSFATARALAGALGLAADRWSVSFQSRLGRTPWIKPYTDLVLPELAQKGVKKVAVFCPAFVADCLETLEEIGIRAKESFLAAGGQELRLVPSLNATPKWVEAVTTLVRQTATMSS